MFNHTKRKRNLCFLNVQIWEMWRERNQGLIFLRFDFGLKINIGYCAFLDPASRELMYPSSEIIRDKVMIINFRAMLLAKKLIIF